MRKFFEAIVLRTDLRGRDYNVAGFIKKEDYWVFGDISLSHELHKEATRICSWAHQGNALKVREHLVDLGVYAAFLWEYLDNQGECEKKEE